MKRAAFVIPLAAAMLPSVAEAQIIQPERELKEVERQLKERRAEETRLTNEVGEREKEIAALRHRMIEAADALQSAERRIAEINAEIDGLESEENALLANLRREQTTLGEVLGALQTIERARPPALLVSPRDAAAAARTAMLLADVAPQIEARAATLRATLARLQQIRKALAAERADFEKTNEEIIARRALLADLLERKEQESRIAEELAAAAQSETAALAIRATTLREVLERLERLARSVAPRLKPPRFSPGRAPELAKPEPFRPAQPFALARGALKPPLVGNVIGRFGAPRPEGGRFDGLRFSAADKAIVTAPFEGNVSIARAWPPIGNLIILDVGGGYHILMLGLGAFLVKEGQSVKAGEPIAAMVGDGAELDLEIRKDGEPVNPSLWLSPN